MEQQYGKGAIKDTPDKRDFQYSEVAFSLPPFDWEAGYDIETIIGKKLKVKDQDGSGSCGGQAWAYYGEVLDVTDHEEKSAKFIYSQTFVGGGGSAGRTNCELVINKGWADENKCISYENGFPPSEAFMERKSDLTKEAFDDAFIDRGLSYANVAANIDLVAQAIRENKGLVIGIAGKNNGTWTSKFPKPPTDLVGSWNHWVYVGKAKMIDGKKYIGFINSWGEDVGDKGWQWISEDYVKYPLVWSVWTMVFDFPLYKFTKTMRFGSIGSEVKQLQKRVGVSQDGIFGWRTRNAVIQYQKSHGLKGDGIVGPLTRAVLNK